MTHSLVIDSPIGYLTVYGNCDSVTEIRFGKFPAAVVDVAHTDEILSAAATQLGEYFRGERRAFDLSLKPHGTPFQQSVWNALLNIPYGETRSYAEIAAAINNPRACRAVGNANGKNPIPILIPCHRVITANHKLGGYAASLEIKRKLLEIEGTTRGKTRSREEREEVRD